MTNKQAEVRAASTQSSVLDHECAVVDTFDSIKEARVYVKRLMDHDYWKRATENQDCEPIRYAQIWVDGECLYDFFAKGYYGEAKEECNEA